MRGRLKCNTDGIVHVDTTKRHLQVYACKANLKTKRGHVYNKLHRICCFKNRNIPCYLKRDDIRFQKRNIVRKKYAK